MVLFLRCRLGQLSLDSPNRKRNRDREVADRPPFLLMFFEVKHGASCLSWAAVRSMLDRGDERTEVAGSGERFELSLFAR
jgi:hypothetical protein